MNSFNSPRNIHEPIATNPNLTIIPEAIRIKELQKQFSELLSQIQNG
jgi:hypothetical protein